MPHTRSNSLSKPAESRTRAREQESSPEMDHNKSKKAKTDTQIIIDLMVEMKKEFGEKMDKMVESLNGKIDGIKDEIDKLRRDINENKSQMDEMKIKHIEHDTQLISHEIRLNIIDQLALENQVMITNLPMAINKDKFLDDFNKWSNNMMHPSKLSKLNMNTYQNTSKTAFVHFHDVGDKTKLLQFIQNKQRIDPNKFNPITNEMVFTLAEGDISKPKIIDFRTPMTDVNKQIHAQAVKMKREHKSIQNIRLVNGSIQVRLKDNPKPMIIHSIEQLNNIHTTTATSVTQNL